MLLVRPNAPTAVRAIARRAGSRAAHPDRGVIVIIDDLIATKVFYDGMKLDVKSLLEQLDRKILRPSGAVGMPAFELAFKDFLEAVP